MSISTPRPGRDWARAIRPDGRDWWRNCCSRAGSETKPNTVHLVLVQPDQSDRGVRTHACSVHTRVNALRFEPRPSFPGCRSKDLEALKLDAANEGKRANPIGSTLRSSGLYAAPNSTASREASSI